MAAKYAGVDDRLGSLAVGKGADFIVLDANPLEDIRNTRRIAQVYLRGKQLNRTAMKDRWQAAIRQAVRPSVARFRRLTCTVTLTDSPALSGTSGRQARRTGTPIAPAGVDL